MFGEKHISDFKLVLVFILGNRKFGANTMVLRRKKDSSETI